MLLVVDVDLENLENLENEEEMEDLEAEADGAVAYLNDELDDEEGRDDSYQVFSHYFNKII